MSSTTRIITLWPVENNLKDRNCSVIKEYSDTTLKQTDVQRLWLGSSHEDSRMIQIFVNMKPKSNDEYPQVDNSHQRSFQELSAHASASNINAIHVDFQPGDGVAEALAAPMTEVATFYYEDAPPSTAFKGAKVLLQALENDGVKIMGWAFGTTHEVIERDGFRGKGTVLVVGWDSIEAHFDSHNTQALKDNIHRLTTPDVKALEMHHVRAHAYYSEQLAS